MLIVAIAVEDDPIQARYLSAFLKDCGFEMLSVATAAEAAALVQSRKPDAIFLDQDTPDVDSWGACRGLRELTTAPILVFANRDQPGSIVRALDAGADDFLLKPIPGTILIDHLKRLTRRPGSA